jgi:O-acetyl-ADP-ribose deacetylase (regulator of RNase III)
MLHLISGNILNIQIADAIVCPCNTVGVMGKGLALDFKKAFPKMFDVYKAR